MDRMACVASLLAARAAAIFGRRKSRYRYCSRDELVRVGAVVEHEGQWLGRAQDRQLGRDQLDRPRRHIEVLGPGQASLNLALDGHAVFHPEVVGNG